MDVLLNILNKREETQIHLTGAFDVKEQFTYDNLNRVKSSKVYRKNAGASYQLNSSASYRYDDLGNLNYRSDKGGTFYYNKTNGASVHAVTSANGKSYQYDAYGNATQKGSSNISYGIFNKPTNIDGQQFFYGADHSRYKKVDADGTKTYYLMGGMYEEIHKGPTVTYNSYVDGVYLLQEDVTYGYYGSTKRRYILKDHLGSTTAITNEAGTIEERLSFNTWGERRASDWSSGSFSLSGLDTSRGFTGHEMLDDSGLIHMNGRVYDPTVGRFLSADILIQAPTNTQSYNRYSYVFNNPLSFTDPTGYECTSSHGCYTTTYTQQPIEQCEEGSACRNLQDAQDDYEQEQKDLDAQYQNAFYHLKNDFYELEKNNRYNTDSGLMRLAAHYYLLGGNKTLNDAYKKVLKNTLDARTSVARKYNSKVIKAALASSLSHLGSSPLSTEQAFSINALGAGTKGFTQIAVAGTTNINDLYTIMNAVLDTNNMLSGNGVLGTINNYQKTLEGIYGG